MSKYIKTNNCEKKENEKEKEMDGVKEKEMDEMKEITVFEYYEKEIMFFNRKTDELLVETIMLEIKIAKRRKKGLRSSKKDKKQLKIMIITTLKAIAIVETYRLFQTLKIVLADENIQMFCVRREQCFRELVLLFLDKIITK